VLENGGSLWLVSNMFDWLTARWASMNPYLKLGFMAFVPFVFVSLLLVLLSVTSWFVWVLLGAAWVGVSLLTENPVINLIPGAFWLAGLIYIWRPSPELDVFALPPANLMFSLGITIVCLGAIFK